jgi:predicted transposase YdaD
LLNQVASEVDKIEQPEEREEVIGSTQLLAGLRFKADLVSSLFQGGLMRESTVFQKILQEGRVLGRGEQALAMIYRLLPRRIGVVVPELQQRLLQLSTSQLEDLGEALLDFEEPNDLIVWLDALQDS